MSTGPLRVVLICHHDAPLHHDGVARWIASWATLSGIVVIKEPAVVLRRRLRREWRRVGSLRLLDVFAFRLFYRLSIASRDQAWTGDQLRQLRNRYSDLPAGTRTIEVPSPASKESQAFIEAANPDIVIALCKSILPERVFAIPRFGTFVFHPGICPEYRNAHGCFWALASRDLDRVGLTLLRIDAGVDTGPVYGYFTYKFDERSESHIRIQQRMLFENLDAIRDRLLEAASGEASAIDTTGRKSAVWGQPWLTAYARWKSAAKKAEQDRFIHATANASADAAVPRRRS